MSGKRIKRVIVVVTGIILLFGAGYSYIDDTSTLHSSSFKDCIDTVCFRSGTHVFNHKQEEGNVKEEEENCADRSVTESGKKAIRLKDVCIDMDSERVNDTAKDLAKAYFDGWFWLYDNYSWQEMTLEDIINNKNFPENEESATEFVAD